MRLAVRNTGESDFSFTTALNSCVAVHDIRFPQRSFYKVRVDNRCVWSLCLVHREHSLMRICAGRCWLLLCRQAGRGASRQERDPGHLLYNVRGPVLHPCEGERISSPCVLRGPVDKVYLETQPRLAVEVGTRCTVYVENSEGYTDHVVWHPWTKNSHYTNFLCVGSAAVGRPIRLAPVRPRCCAVVWTLLLTHLFSRCSRRSGSARARCLCATSTRADTCSETTAASLTRPTTPPRLGARTKPQTTGRSRTRPARVMQCVLACTFGVTTAATDHCCARTALCN